MFWNYGVHYMSCYHRWNGSISLLVCYNTYGTTTCISFLWSEGFSEQRGCTFSCCKCFHLWEHFTLFQKLLMTVTLETFFSHDCTDTYKNKLQIKNLFTLYKKTKTKYSCHLISCKLTLTNTQTDRAMDI